MRTAIRSSRIVTKDGVIPGYLLFEEGRILSVTEGEPACDELIDEGDGIVMPGFIDIHTHGGGGHAFADSSAEEVALGCDFHLSHGTTAIMPTVSASTPENMKLSLAAIGEAMERSLCAAHIIGAHLEGPYLAPEMCGAQCTDFITAPKPRDYEQIAKSLGKYIARWTFAPETDEGSLFAKFLKSEGILASIGHTGATYDAVKRAFDDGARLVTHLYSCTSTVTRRGGFRSLGVIESTFLLDGMTAEIIADGKHLPPELISMILKIKGADKVIAVTDSISVAGSGISSGTMCGTDFIIEDGVAKLPDRSAFAGSVATADVLLRVLVFECGLSLPDASKLLSLNAAELLGLPKGSLEAGRDADIVVLDEKLYPKSVFALGKRVK